MSTIITILIIAIIAALVIVGLKETIKHSKGEGACCGGGAMKEDEEATGTAYRRDSHESRCAHRRNALHELQELSHTLASEDERRIGSCGFKAWRGTC